MKRFMIFLIPCLLLQSFAWATPGQNLRQLVDEYQYATTVEWDQQDEEALNAINEKFEGELKTLAEQGKLSMADLREALKGQDKMDPAVLEILKNENGEVALTKLSDLIKDRSQHMYAHGSSWSPGGVFMGGLGILLLAWLAVAIMNEKDDVCPNPGYFPEGVHYDCQWDT